MRHRRLVTFLILATIWLSHTAVRAQTSTEPQTSTNTPVRNDVGTASLADIQRVELELQKLRSEVTAQTQALDAVRTIIQIVAGAVALVGILALLFQVFIFFAESRNRARTREESAKQSEKEDALNEKVRSLEQGGIKKAGETLQLINSLLQITERAAAKAAGAQFDFLSRSIIALDSQCQALVVEATEKDDRDIIAKPQYRERVKVLTKQVESLDNQIITYNESVPSQFAADGTFSGERETERPNSWKRLGLTGPCLFVRGLNQHLDSNFAAAITDWKASLEAPGRSSIEVDANYWIGYVSNTLGDFVAAAPHLISAARVAPERRKVELQRLELETRLFELDVGLVPEELLAEGKDVFEKLEPHRIPARAMSSFATTMGNISMIQNVRAVLVQGQSLSFAQTSSEWYQKAINAVDQSRWAHFGMCQNIIHSGEQLNGKHRKRIEYVIGSVNREFQNRVEHRSKVLSKITEYMCVLMLGDKSDNRLNILAGLIEHLTSDVVARTIYSQFRKQNVDKNTFLEEFYHLRQTLDLGRTFLWANSEQRAAKGS